MNIKNNSIDGVLIIEPRIFTDARGYFFESFSQREFEEKVGKINFVQDNESKSNHPSQSRIGWIDSAKGFAILMIMISHTELATAIPGNVYLYNGYIGLFFICSGLTIKCGDYFLWKRLKRCLIPYFFYGILFGMIFSIPSIVNFQSEVLKDNIAGLLYSRTYIFRDNIPPHRIMMAVPSPLWFLTSMAITYIWFALYIRLERKVTKTGFLVIGTLATLLLYQIPVLLPWSIDTSFLFFLLVMFGYYILKPNIGKTSWQLALVFLVISLPAYIITCNVGGRVNLSVAKFGNYEEMGMVLSLLMSILYTIVVSALFILLDNTIISRFFKYIGRMSLTLMCIHIPFYVIISIMFSQCGYENAITQFPLEIIISCLVASILTAIRKMCNNDKILISYL